MNLINVVLKNGLVFNRKKIYLQSMLNADANDIEANVSQAKKLKNAGCDIIRVAIPKVSNVNLISAIKKHVNVALVADVHYNYKIAIAAIEAGVDKIRINPGTLGKQSEIEQVVKLCKLAKVAIRIGINSGSLEKQILNNSKFNDIAHAMVTSALNNIEFFEKLNFNQIVVSLKSSDVIQTIKAYRILRKKCSYPFHLGITETGTLKNSAVKSSIVIGSLLLDGIGETFRVTLTGDPVEEIEIGHLILKSLNLETKGINLIACPTCGRTKINILKIAKTIEQKTKHIVSPIKIAIMGCVVNGPGEAKNADLAIVGGDGCAIFYKNGIVCKKIEESEIVDFVLNEIFILDKKLKNKI